MSDNSISAFLRKGGLTMSLLLASLPAGAEAVVLHEPAVFSATHSVKALSPSLQKTADDIEGVVSGAGDVAGYDVMSMSGYDGEDTSGVFIPEAYTSTDPNTGAVVVKANQSQLQRARMVQAAKRKAFIRSIVTGQSQAYKVSVTTSPTTQVLQVSTPFLARYLILGSYALSSSSADCELSQLAVNQNVLPVGGQTTTSTTVTTGTVAISQLVSGKLTAIDIGCDDGQLGRQLTQSSILSFSVSCAGTSTTARVQAFLRGPMSDQELSQYYVVSTASPEGLKDNASY